AIGAGVALGGLMLLGVSLNTWRVDRHITQLQTACQEENKKQRAKPEFKDLDFQLICDATALDPETPGVQGALARAQKQRSQWVGWHDWLISAAVFIMVAGSLPFAWYFLLRRIRELSSAIIGR